ncbi:MAG: spermidine synthase [Candidatus Promineifilaceae bacterium]
MRSRSYLYLTVFVAGMTTLAVEFTTSRMLQTVFGTSNIVWANVIGLVLLFLTLGYFIGGRLADRAPAAGSFYWLVTAAGFCAVFFLLLTSVVLRAAASALAALNVGALLASLAVVLLALALPITLLGTISPFAVRLAVRDVAEAGRVSGRIYAVSTWGSLLGTYLPVLVVIPLAGSRAAAVLFGSLLLVIGLGGLWRSRRRSAARALALPLILAGPVALWSQGPLKAYPGQIFEAESSYNYIQVIRAGDCNYLLLNEGQAYHSYYCDGGRVPRISVWSIMLAGPAFNDPAAYRPPHNLAVIGLAAGTVAKQFSQAYGPQPIDGIELDPAIVDAGRRYFAMDEPNLRVIVGDGRFQLNRLNRRYDLITLDAYKVPYIPWHMTTREFFSEVKAYLREQGVLAINVGRVPGDRRLVNAISATLLEVFPSVHTVDVPLALNTILFATVQDTTSSNLTTNLAALEPQTEPLLRAILTTAAENLTPSMASDVIFTDERAAVETMIDSIVIGYFLREGPAGLPGLPVPE